MTLRSAGILARKARVAGWNGSRFALMRPGMAALHQGALRHLPGHKCLCHRCLPLLLLEFPLHIPRFELIWKRNRQSCYLSFQG
jgi:hypothetical protein